jgi:ABC-type lipoprotein release transport system permease subunit/competence protein ComGC
MNIFTTTNINLKKLKEQRTKALFLIVPIFILLTITVVVTSQLSNFQVALDQAVFNILEDQATLIQLSKNSSGPSFQQFGGMKTFQEVNFNNNFSESDIAVIQGIENVQAASLNTSVPVQNAVSPDLFDGVNYKANALRTLDSTSAALYTDEPFEYTEGKEIPIILNSNTFMESYEEWNGQTSIAIDFFGSRPKPGQEVTEITNPTPIKSRAIEYTKEDLIGKTFTIDFGGFDSIQDYKTSNSNGVLTFTKLTQEELDAKYAARKSAISPYWDYDKLSAPISYTFKVVGVIDLGDSSYIPESFANKVMKDVTQKQLDAKIANVPTDLLDKTFIGLSFDGAEFSSDFGAGFSRVISGGAGPVGAVRIDMKDSAESSSTYTIPGLIIKTSSDGKNTVEGVYTDANAFATSLKKSPFITIKVSSVYERSNVIAAINDAGYAVTDTNDFSVFSQIQSTLSSVSFLFVISFIALISFIILITMMRFVSESRKEIGIFRAMGMKKSGVMQLFVSQALLYIFFALVLGVIAGIVVNTAFSTIIGNSFNGFVADTIQKTFNVTANLDASIFNQIDLSTVGIYSVMLIVITLIVSLIPAYRASQISPVEAIRGE